jgi:hypothetical protein
MVDMACFWISPLFYFKGIEKLNQPYIWAKSKQQETKWFDPDVTVEMIDPSFKALFANLA